MGHSHHSHHPVRVSARARRFLLLAIAPFLVTTIVGLLVLWPEGRDFDLPQASSSRDELRASVTEVEPKECPDIPGQENFVCSTVTVELAEGEDEGDTFSFDYSTGPQTRSIKAGDSVIVGRDPSAGTAGPGEEASEYFFLGYDRRSPLLVLAVAFSVVVVALSRWRGLAALGGLAVSLFVLIQFVLPALLEGREPVVVALIGGATIMFLALYLAHGLSATTSTAVLGTLLSLLLTGLLAFIFVNISIFTGVGSEEAAFLEVSQQQVNLQGLLLASIIIGTLGVLDDVTVTQASAVWELHRANPEYGIRNLYRAGIRIGRDHIASTVNTLVLAYAGASLPLLILFSISNRSLGDVLNTESVAGEVVRTLVGSIGLVASVPITTGLAALVVSAGTQVRRGQRDDDDFDIERPRREREFWDDDSRRGRRSRGDK
jgi:uncharacterized membrane protein